MSGDTETKNLAEEEDSGARTSYDRSTIQFPYFDLAESVRMAEAMSANVGNDEAADEQLAAWLDLSPKSSGYRSRVASARLFGLLEQGSNEEHRLTELGLEVVSEDHARKGLAKAFLNVPLFNKVYENWRGHQLPPSAALERAMVGMGVAKKQAQRARQVLERSALTAGFYEHGRDKLVRPGIKSDSLTPPPPPENGGKGGGSGGGSGGDSTVVEGLDPIIVGLLQRLPKSGSTWSKDKRKIWLGLLEGSFDLIYEDSSSSKPKNDVFE